MKLNFRWKQKIAQYSSGDWLYLNRICVGGYEWNSTHSRLDKDYEAASDE